VYYSPKNMTRYRPYLVLSTVSVLSNDFREYC
jgi:hypothetical protein